MDYKAILEGLLFVVGDDGLTIAEIANIIELDDNEAKEVLNALMNDYEKENRGIKIGYLGNSYKLITKPEHRDYYQKLIENTNSNLSQSALEILAIVVYNEPVTRVQIDNIRGIGSAQMIRKLVAKGFLKEVGRSTLPGRPILYATTDEFLDYFGLATKEDLPKIEFNEEIVKETDLFTTRYKEDE